MNSGDFRYDPEKFNGKVFVPEYRTLGGNMLKDESYIGFVYDQTIAAIQWYNNFDYALAEQYGFDVQRAIDTADIKLVENLLKTFNIQNEFVEQKRFVEEVAMVW